MALEVENGAVLITSRVRIGGALPDSQEWRIRQGTSLRVEGDLDLTNNTLRITGGGTTGISGVISGTGGLVKGDADGVLTLSASNTFSGGVNIQAGTVKIDHPNSLGTGLVTFSGGNLELNPAVGSGVIANPFLLLAGGEVRTTGAGLPNVAGQITGPDAFRKAGTGALALSNPANTYSGGTILLGGTLYAGNSHLGSGPIIFQGGDLVVTSDESEYDNPVGMNSNGTINTAGFIRTVSGTISGTGKLTKTGIGIDALRLTGTNTFTGGVHIQSGYLYANGNSLGTGDVTFTTGTKLVLNGNQTIANNLDLRNGAMAILDTQSTTTTLAGTIFGSGTFVKDGFGRLILTGPLNHTGGTFVSLHQLEGTTSTLKGSINISTNAQLEFSQSFTGEFFGSLADNQGPGVVIKSGAGTVIFNNVPNSISGGTHIRGGTLVANGTNLGSGPIEFNMGGGTLELNGSGAIGNRLIFGSTGIIDTDVPVAVSILGERSGSGTFRKRGSGTLTLSGPTTHTGSTEIDAGTVFVTSTIAGEVIVNSGGTLNGTGTVIGNVSVNTGGSMRGMMTIQNSVFSSGLIAPGFVGAASAKTIAIDGNLVMMPQATLDIEIGGEQTSEHDLLQVGGMASLAGVVDLQLINGFLPVPYDPITVLSGTSGVQDIFDGVSGVEYGSDFGLAVTYGTNSVEVRGALLGDINLDHVVDGSDFNIWNSHKFTSGNTWITGDLNGDGTTDGSDFTIWNAHKFTSASMTQTVPEPMLFSMFSLVVAILWARRALAPPACR